MPTLSEYRNHENHNRCLHKKVLDNA